MIQAIKGNLYLITSNASIPVELKKKKFLYWGIWAWTGSKHFYPSFLFAFQNKVLFSFREYLKKETTFFWWKLRAIIILLFSSVILMGLKWLGSKWYDLRRRLKANLLFTKVTQSRAFGMCRKKKNYLSNVFLCFRDGRNCMSLISALLVLKYIVSSMALYYCSAS